MSPRFLHCYVTLFSFVIKKYFCGRYFGTMYISCSLTNFIFKIYITKDSCFLFYFNAFILFVLMPSLSSLGAVGAYSSWFTVCFWHSPIIHWVLLCFLSQDIMGSSFLQETLMPFSEEQYLKINILELNVLIITAVSLLSVLFNVQSWGT